MGTRDLQSSGMVVMLTVLTMLLTDELHGWPAPDELAHGCSRVVFCKICGDPCLVRCVLHVGIQLGGLWEVWGFLGLPTHQFVRHSSARLNHSTP